jgi:CarboxypepD_reg-like domain/TonB-dependent Receptor Plug Domain
MKRTFSIITTLLSITDKVVEHTFKTLFYLLFAIVLASPAFAQQSAQTIRGTIIDRESKQPLIGATVTVSNGTLIGGTTTDADGNFKIEKIPLGRKNVKVTYLGYEVLNYPDVMVTAGKEVILNLSMVEAVNKMNEVTISYDRKKDPTVTNNEMATISSRSFNPDDTKKYAGSLGDPSRMAANFAGVVSGNDSRNDIVVRGNSPNAMLWQMEGVNIPNPNHFGASFNTGGPVSMLNSNNIGKSDFFTSAFPAQYGNANGGVFDLALREGNNEKREFLGQIGFNGFEVGAEGPFSKTSKASYIFNYRYSTLGLMSKIGVDVGTGAATPLYQDMNFKIAVPTKGKGKITFWGMGGFSSIDLLGKDVDTNGINFYGQVDQNTIPRYRTAVTGAGYEKRLTAKTWAKFTLAASHSYSSYYTDSLALPTENAYRKSQGHFQDNKYSAVVTITHKFNAKNSLNAGFTNDLTQFDYFNKDVYNMGMIDSIRVNQQGSVNLAQAYMQWKHRFNARFTSNVGLHAQHMSVNEQIVVEPRVGLRYAINDQSSVNAGYGLHHQMLPVYNIFVQNAQGEQTNKNLDFTRSNHFVLGYENMLTQTLKIKVEAYYQYLNQIPVNNYPSSYSSVNVGAAFEPSDESNLVNEGTGENYGLELTLERYFNKGFYYLVTGSLFDSKYKGSDGIERNTAFNTKYAANILAGKEFKVGKKGTVLYTNLKLTTIGGRYFTPLDFAASQTRGSAVYDRTNAFSEKQTAYFRMDMKVGYRKDFKASSMEFAVDFQNLTNHQNIFSQGYNKFRNTVSYEYQQGFFPVPTFRYTF